MNWTHIFIYILVAFTLPISALSDTEPLPDFNVLKKQAEEGDMESQFQLGRCYAFGTGTDKNGKQAALWFRKAAEQGHAKAQYNIGGDCQNHQRCHHSKADKGHTEGR